MFDGSERIDCSCVLATWEIIELVVESDLEGMDYRCHVFAFVEDTSLVESDI